MSSNVMELANHSCDYRFTYRTNDIGPIEACVAYYVTFVLTVIVQRFRDIADRAIHERGHCDPVIVVCITDTIWKRQDGVE